MWAEATTTASESRDTGGGARADAAGEDGKERRGMRKSIVVMFIFGSGCGGGPADPLDAAGPPRILQVLARERVAIVDDEGHEHVELAARLAFGDHPDIDAVTDCPFPCL